MPVNIGIALFDGNHGQLLLALLIVANVLGVHVNDGFRGLSPLAPSRLRTPSASIDNRLTCKQRHQPDSTGFVSTSDSTRFEEDSQSSSGDV